MELTALGNAAASMLTEQSIYLPNHRASGHPVVINLSYKISHHTWWAKIKTHASEGGSKAVTVFNGCSVDTGQEEAMKTVPTSVTDHFS